MRSEEEDAVQAQIAPLRQQYQQKYQELKILKTEITRIKQIIDNT